MMAWAVFGGAYLSSFVALVGGWAIVRLLFNRL